MAKLDERYTMKNQTAQNPSETKGQTAPEPTEVQSKQVAALSNATAEANAFRSSLKAVIGTVLGNLAVDAIARELGENASVLGRPTDSDWFALAIALQGHPEYTGDRRQTVTRIAMAAHKAKFGHDPKFKPVGKQTAKAGANLKGSITYALNVPATFNVLAQ